MPSSAATRTPPQRGGQNRPSPRRAPSRGVPTGRASASAKVRHSTSTRLAAPPPLAVHAQRMERLAALASAQGVDHVLISNPFDVGYLTGFLGGDSFLAVGPALGTKHAV